MSPPWHRERPTGAVDIEIDDDAFLTVDKWPKQAFGAHYHDDFNWLVPMRAGRYAFTVEGEDVVIDERRWLCVFPRVAHVVEHISDEGEMLSLFVPNHVMERAFDRCDPKPRLDRGYLVGERATIAQGLALAWGEIRFAERSAAGLPRDASDPFDDAFALYLGGFLWRAASPCDAPASEHPGLELRIRLGALGESVAAFFDDRLADTPFPWDDLTKKLGLSQRTLQRRFVEAVGVAPTEALVALRLERAKDLLRDPARRLVDVALACGFASHAHFSTVFKARTGATPAEFRKSLREGA